MSRVSTGPRSPGHPPGRFIADSRGSVAIVFGLMTFILFTFIGAAVDMGRWLQARRVTMDAMEAATLAGLRNYQETHNESQAEAQALLNYQANTLKRPTVTSDTVNFKLVDNGTSVSMSAQGNANYQTLFLAVLPHIMNIKTLPILRQDNSEHPVAKLALGQNSGTSLEVSLMLDITGSMADVDSSGKTKIDSLKDAAQKLIDIVVWADQSTYTSKVALVPFSAAVNLGTTLTPLARGTVASTLSTIPNATNKFTNSYKNKYKLSSTCVTERTGTEKYTDTSYTTAKVGPLYTSNGSCVTPNVVMPLDNNKTTLKNAIKTFTASGVTAGQIGTAWAWYTLSPNFNSLWGNTTHNARAYSELTTLNSKGRPILNKIAVLMTDGDYNTWYCYGEPSDGCSPNPNGDSNTQALALCNGMKAKGITVYTIGFMVSSAAKTLLTSCATDSAHYYDANDGAQLLQAFTDIAYKLVPPYVAH